MHQDFTLLPPTLILAPLVCFSKKRLFEELSESAGFLLKLPPKEINQALYAREAAGNTVVAPGIAIPHAVVDGAMPSLLIVSMLDEKVDFQPLDSKPMAIDIAFAFFFAPQSKLEEAEEILEGLSEILQNSDLTASLRRAHHDESKVDRLLHKIDTRLTQKLRPELQENEPEPPTAEPHDSANNDSDEPLDETVQAIANNLAES